MPKLALPAALSLTVATAASAAPPPQIPNPKIDYAAYLKVAEEVEATRRERRLTEEQFIAMAAQPGTVVLDAHSADKFRLLHIKGAVSLPFTDFTAETLAQVIPSKDTRILIYCNNNFRGDETAFATKAAPASLNISTYVNLAIYGYRNIYELGPLLDVKHTKLSLETTAGAPD